MRKYCEIATLIVLAAGCFSGTSANAFPRTPQQSARLKKYIPRTAAKLEAKSPVYVVTMGDSVTWGNSVLPNDSKNHGNSHIGYPGIFLNKLAKEFFYPGGVRLVNPPAKIPQKPTPYLGDEILFENLAKPGRCMIDGIQNMTTEVFVHDPDLITINYGINDALRKVPLDQYRRALQYLIDAAKSRQADVIVLGPNIVRMGGKGAINWGLTRPYTMTARDVADANGVLFIDLGQSLSRWGGSQELDVEPDEAMKIVNTRLERIMDWGPKMLTLEELHPNHKANEYMGLAMFDELMNLPEASDYTIKGNAEFVNERQVKVTLSLRNQSNELRVGTLGALAWEGRLDPEFTETEFILPAGKNKLIDFIYNRHVVGKHPDGSVFYGPWSVNDTEMRLSYVLSDGKRTEILEPRGVKLSPITVAWRSRFVEQVSDTLRIEWNLLNGTQKAVSGKYRVGMGDEIAPAIPFSLPPLGDKKFEAKFPFRPPAGAARFQKGLFVEVEVDGKKIRFDREVEASKDLVIGEKVALSPHGQYAMGNPSAGAQSLNGQPGVTIRADADADALFIVAELEGLNLQDLGDQAAVMAEVYVDARPQSEVRTFGFVEAVRIGALYRGGPGITHPIQLGSFGNGYNMILDARGITSTMKTVNADTRRLEIRIPRSYLFRHEWQAGSPDSILGLQTVILLGRLNPKTGAVEYPRESQFVLTAPEMNLDGAHLAGLYYKNALSLQTLRLSRTPVKTWSVRIF
ncbi:SGNH/GDSL hydrolase family protein [bacterium]|nr:SGNH/GDSL hydrolase family protein [bacterium]